MTFNLKTDTIFQRLILLLLITCSQIILSLKMKFNIDFGIS
jgi:hypothetical protein